MCRVCTLDLIPLIFCLEKTLCLHGGQEQRNLKPPQFHREYNPDHYVYVENGFKNHSRGFGSGKQCNEVVTLYNNHGFEPQYVLFLLDLHLSKCA